MTAMQKISNMVAIQTLTSAGESSRICSRCVLPSTFPRISFDSEGVCSVCRDYDRWTGQWKSKLHKKQRDLEKICSQAKAKRKEFDAIVPLSGGKDSTYVLYFARRKLGLKCMSYTLDNGYLSNYARKNIENTCKKLEVEHVYYRFDTLLMRRLFALFIRKTGCFCSVCMRAIGMSQALVSNMYNAPLVISGTSLRTELPLSKEMFQDGTVSHVHCVLEGEHIAAECGSLLYSGNRRRKFGYLLFLLSKKKILLTYAWFNLADYIDWNYNNIYDTIRRELNWQSPDKGEHMDCVIHPIQKYIQARRFPGLEQERLILARLVMAGQISREEALQRLKNPVQKCSDSTLNNFLGDINMSKEEFESYIDAGQRHLNFDKSPDLARRIMLKLFPTRQAGNY